MRFDLGNPGICAVGDSIIFHLCVPTEHGRLVIRCDPDGVVRASIALDNEIRHDSVPCIFSCREMRE